jgi:hypothetical protein
MDRSDLQAALDEAEVRRDAYSLTGGNASETYCLDQGGSAWLVYYAERGQRNEIGRFASEDDTCLCLLAVLLHDPTTRVRYVRPIVPP